MLSALVLVLALCLPAAAYGARAMRVTEARLLADEREGRSASRLAIDAVIAAPHGGAAFLDAMLAGQVSVTVEAGSTMERVQPITGCRRQFAPRSVRCRSADGTVSATAVHSDGTRLTVSLRHLPPFQPGAPRQRVPLVLTVHAPGVDLEDAIGDCRTLGAAVLCRDRGRPNIVLIITDDQRWDTLEYMPRLQRLLVAQGVTFSNAFVTTPLCCPSRTSTLTGQYVYRHNVRGNSLPAGGATRFVGKDASTVATWLHDSGYRTGLYGKYLNDYLRQCSPATASCYRPPGWDEWHAFVEQNYYNYQLAENARIVDFGVSAGDYSTDVLTAKAVEFISTARGQPFFLYLAYNAPHDTGLSPAVAAPRHQQPFDSISPWRPPSYDEEDVADKAPWLRLPRANDHRGFYTYGVWTDLERQFGLASLFAVDEGIEAIVAALAAAGVLDDTVILFTADNGFLWGEHRLWAQKGWFYDESLRVPLIIAGRRLISESRTESALALNIDLAPTLAELAGVTPASTVDGRSLVPLLRQEASSWRSDFLFETWHPFFDRRVYVGVRSEQQLYCEYPGLEFAELYDDESDPFQLENRASDPAFGSLRSALGARLAEHLATAGSAP